MLSDKTLSIGHNLSRTLTELLSDISTTSFTTRFIVAHLMTNRTVTPTSCGNEDQSEPDIYFFSTKKMIMMALLFAVSNSSPHAESSYFRYLITAFCRKTEISMLLSMPPKVEELE